MTLLKKHKINIKKTYKLINNKFDSVFIKQKDPKYKTYIFVSYLCGTLTFKDIALACNDLYVEGIYKNYETYFNNLPKWVNCIIDYLKKQNVEVNQKHLEQLIANIVELFDIDYKSKPLHLLAVANLNDHYENKINLNKQKLKLIESIHNNLIDILPGRMDLLVLILNNLLEQWVD